MVLAKWVGLILLLSLGASAEDLAHYRPLGTPVITQAEALTSASERRGQIRQYLLGAEGRFAGAVGARVAALATPATSRSHYLTSSAYVKRFSSRIAMRILQDFNHGKPLPFNPNDLPHEIDANIRAHRDQICREEVGENFDLIVQQLLAGLVQPSSTPATVADPTQAERSQALEALITELDPNPDESIVSKLGKLYKTPVLDGKVWRLYFTKEDVAYGADVDLPDDKEVSMDLSMLISFRIGVDRFFVDTMDYFVRTVEEYLETRSKKRQFGEEELTQLRDYLLGKRDGARFVNSVVGLLTRAQVDFLIDLFLELRGNDLPVPQDVTHLRNEMKKAGNSPAAQLVADYDFYRQMNDELYFLEETLREERELRVRQEEILDDYR